MKRFVMLAVLGAVALSACEDKERKRLDLERRLTELGATAESGRFLNVSVREHDTLVTCAYARTEAGRSTGYEDVTADRLGEVARQLAESLSLECMNDDLKKRLQDDERARR